jgi:tripartite-type tricarboxylate transporter receptor subunit TctC
VVIEYRPGAAGSIAVEVATKAPPDGYTLVFVGAGQIVNNPYLMKLSYDPITDLTPVAFLVHACMLLVAHPSVPVKSAKELIALAKAHPGKLNVSSGGSGAVTHLAAELLQSLTGTSMTHIPYKGAAAAMIDVMGGRVDMMFVTNTASAAHVAANRLRALAVTSAKRTAALPNLPTVAEAGIPGYETSVWYALLTTGGTPRAAVERLGAEEPSDRTAEPRPAGRRHRRRGAAGDRARHGRLSSGEAHVDHERDAYSRARTR